MVFPKKVNSYLVLSKKLKPGYKSFKGVKINNLGITKRVKNSTIIEIIVIKLLCHHLMRFKEGQTLFLKPKIYSYFVI